MQSFAALVLAMFAAVAAGQSLDGDGTGHSDADYKTIYEELLGIDHYDSESSKFVEDVLRKMRDRGQPMSTLLEVGPGPGQIASAFGRVFQQVFLVEPNSHFRETIGQRFFAKGLTYNMHPGLFEDFECRKVGYDLVVLSHMLYHVDQSKRAGFLEKAYNCVAAGGLMAVAMIHDDGDQYSVVRKFDIKNSSAAEVREYFKQRGISSESDVKPTTVVYDQPSVADNFEAAYKLVYFLVVEDALTRGSYRSMTVQQSKAFEKQLRDYTWSLMDERSKRFSLTMIDEYVFAMKDRAGISEL